MRRKDYISKSCVCRGISPRQLGFYLLHVLEFHCSCLSLHNSSITGKFFIYGSYGLETLFMYADINIKNMEKEILRFPYMLQDLDPF